MSYGNGGWGDPEQQWQTEAYDGGRDELPPSRPVKPARQPVGLSRKSLSLLALGLAILAVIAGTGVVLALIGSPGGQPIAAAATATSTTAPAATYAGVPASKFSTATPAPIPSGWQAAGPSYALDVAIATGGTGYVCGYAPGIAPAAAATKPLHAILSSNQAAPIVVSVTRDNGSTWSSPITTNAIGDASHTSCRIAINPYNSPDVVLIIDPCGLDGCSPAPPDQAFRSRDAGQSWSQIMLPAMTGFQPGDVSGELAWGGTTLYVQPYGASPGGPLPTHFLAASVSGGAFAWADSGLPQNGAGLYRLFTNSSGVIARIITGPCGTCDTSYQYAGNAWSPFTPTANNSPVAITFADSTGSLLSGTINNGNATVISTDGGKSWRTIQSGISPSPMAYSPFGTIYATIAQSGSTKGAPNTLTVMRSPDNGSSWQVAAVLPANTVLTAVSWQSGGQPVALWAKNQAPGQVQSGLLKHAP